MIELKQVVVQLGSFALGPLDLSIERGSYWLVVGPSGAGKSLLLEIIAGFRQPDRGTIQLRGREANTLPPERRHCAWVPQLHALFSHLNVHQNIEYGLRCRGIPQQEREQRVQRWAERLDIQHLLTRSTPDLSGGESQRVALARALVTDCDVLLLDEPFASLEPGRRTTLGRLVSDVQREYKLTVVHVTHHPQETMVQDHRVLLLETGSPVYQGAIGPQKEQSECLKAMGRLGLTINRSPFGPSP